MRWRRQVREWPSGNGRDWVHLLRDASEERDVAEVREGPMLHHYHCLLCHDASGGTGELARSKKLVRKHVREVHGL